MTDMEYKDGTTYDVENSWGYTAEAALSYLFTQNIFIQVGVKFRLCPENQGSGTHREGQFFRVYGVSHLHVLTAGAIS